MQRSLRTYSLMAAGLAALPLAAADSSPQRGPISVFVQARPDEPEPSAEQKAARKAAAEAADQASDQLVARLKDQFGKDKAKWPEPQRTEYYDALEKFSVAWSEHYYYARPAKEKAESVKDTMRYFARNRKAPWVVLAKRRDDADLIVEILGRKGQGQSITGSKYLGFDVLPGKGGPERLLKLPRHAFKPWSDDQLWILHWVKPNEPYLRIEVMDHERWPDVALLVGRSIDELAKAYYADLKP